MGLDLYAIACNEFSWELKESLTKEDVDELRTDCAALGVEGWAQWTIENSDIIFAYVTSTPSQRQKKKALKDKLLRSRLVLASIHHVLRAGVLLETLDIYNLVPGKSYRETAALAGKIWLEVYLKEIPYWPFPGKNPFSE